jgi:hypothetical protein
MDCLDVHLYEIDYKRTRVIRHILDALGHQICLLLHKEFSIDCVVVMAYGRWTIRAIKY